MALNSSPRVNTRVNRRGRARASTSSIEAPDMFTIFANLSAKEAESVSASTTPRKRSSWFPSSTSKKDKKPKIPIEPVHSLIYLKISTEYALSTSKRKKKPYKAVEISVTSTRIKFGRSNVPPILLHNICSIKPTTESINRKENADIPKTLLLVTKELTRLWIKFDTYNECIRWTVIINGLSNTSINPLLTLTVQLKLVKEIYFKSYVGGTIKVGDYEEWSYIRDHSEITCILSEDSIITGVKFNFDGQFLFPYNEDNKLGAGEWDGLNIYWYFKGLPIEDNPAKRKTLADLAFHWVPYQEEFRPLQNGIVFDDPFNTWKWARNFLTRKQQSSHDWVQKEGEVPLPISMFLCMYKWASVTDPPPVEELNLDDEYFNP